MVKSNANYAEICRVGNLEADFQQVPLVHFFCRTLSTYSIFRENRCPPAVNFQFGYRCDLEIQVKITKI